MDIQKKPNHLINQKSPYLLQHAYNPVNWYPWSEEAFAEAKKKNQPIFLSIGYSTCHWCHVMERESFEDQEVADYLNRHFVSIKVDREERPDIDHIYMTVCQALTGQGGWPLTVLLTPDKKPFFAGTYFPKRTKWGRSGLLDILEQVTAKWQKDRDAITRAGDQIVEQLQFNPQGADTGLDPGEIAEQCFNELRSAFDRQHGGFGAAPKFPTPHNIIFLLRYWKSSGHDEALAMAEKTLQSMFRGGIYDHVGFGFARYSTDQYWLVPHFEKMLYDNALLALAFLEAYQATNNDFYARVASEIFTYVLRDMTHPEGGFYSAEDADSEGVEGKFYVWTPTEVEEVIGEGKGRIYNRVYEITPNGNFEGHSIPNLISGLPSERAPELGLEPEKLVTMLEEARQKLFVHREKRVHPHKDDKILTAWNGLMIAALARGAAVLGQGNLLEAAQKAEAFIRGKLIRADRRLLARYRDGEAAYEAYLDDYAFMTWGLIELYRATFKPEYLVRAVELVGQTRDLFWDAQKGGFFFYGSDAEQLIARPKEVYDGALPSGNSVMALNMLVLAATTGDTEMEDTARHLINTFAGTIAEHPQGYTYFVTALLFSAGAVTGVTVSGDRDDQAVQEMLDMSQQRYNPDTVFIYYPGDEERKALENLAPHIKERRPVNGRAAAYVCRDRACREPITESAMLAELLQ
ncbi:MAG TPA: thioredoxin domain-containing protein [Desulfotomaculum sp.]|nr:MAG: thioredoxin [Desulfotomaculum sp. BICA1-6]HBX22586.1 thioredoxin domain-containing protein [Desulfotomaculum sp.]